MTYLEQAFEKAYAILSGKGAKQRITYAAVNHSERFVDPEEQVRAEYWAELIFRYGYKPACIGVEVTVPDRTPKDAGVPGGGYWIIKNSWGSAWGDNGYGYVTYATKEAYGNPHVQAITGEAYLSPERNT